MDTTIITNILFACLSMSIIFITIGFIFITIYFVSFLKNIHALINIIKKESEKISVDIDGVREKIKDTGATLTSFISRIIPFLKKTTKKVEKN